MGTFLVRRFINYLVLVALAASAGYLLAATALHPRANYEGRNPPPPAKVVDQKLYELNLNDKTPVVERFKHWAGGVIHLDFGKTWDGKPIGEDMRRRIGVSLRLLLIGSLIGTILGVLLGVACAVKQYQPTDFAATLFSFLILSTPVFLLAIILQYFATKLNDGLGSSLLYMVGEKSPGHSGGWLSEMGDRARHLLLPTLSIALGQIAFYSRYQRSTMLDVLGSDFLRTARAKGLRKRQALFKHGLRTALIPLATFFAYGFGLLITGATFTEKLFGWHGMGEWFITAVTRNDVNVVAAVVVFDAILVLIAGMLADLAYAALDPRVRIR